MAIFGGDFSVCRMTQYRSVVWIIRSSFARSASQSTSNRTVMSVSADRRGPIDPQCAARVPNPLRDDLAAPDGYAHGGGDRPQRDAGAADQRLQQHVGGTGEFARAAARLVQSRGDLAMPGIDDDRDVVRIQAALRSGVDAGGVRLVSVKLLQRCLHGAQFIGVHVFSLLHGRHVQADDDPLEVWRRCRITLHDQRIVARNDQFRRCGVGAQRVECVQHLADMQCGGERPSRSPCSRRSGVTSDASTTTPRLVLTLTNCSPAECPPVGTMPMPGSTSAGPL